MSNQTENTEYIRTNKYIMSIWNKQDWIKDILSKSGTEITEIKDEENKGGLCCGIMRLLKR